MAIHRNMTTLMWFLRYETYLHFQLCTWFSNGIYFLSVLLNYIKNVRFWAHYVFRTTLKSHCISCCMSLVNYAQRKLGITGQIPLRLHVVENCTRISVKWWVCVFAGCWHLAGFSISKPQRPSCKSWSIFVIYSWLTVNVFLICWLVRVSAV